MVDIYDLFAKQMLRSHVRIAAGLTVPTVDQKYVVPLIMAFGHEYPQGKHQALHLLDMCEGLTVYPGLYVHNRIPWNTYIAMGMHPTDVAALLSVRKMSGLSEYINHDDGHPLVVATYYLECAHRYKDDRALTRARAARDSFEKAQGNSDPSRSRHWLMHKHGLLLPWELVASAGMQLEFGHENDELWAMPWYTRSSMNDTVYDRHRYITNVPEALRLTESYMPYSSDTVQALRNIAAKRVVEYAMGQKNSRSVGKYDAPMKLLRMASPAEAARVADKLTGSYAMVNLARSDATSHSAVEGLRVLARSTSSLDKTILQNTRYEFSAKELCSVRSERMLDLIYRMPWPLLQRAVAEGREELVASLLRHIDKSPRMLERALIDHPLRIQLSEDEGGYTPPISWNEYFEHTYQTAEASRRLTEAINQHVEVPTHRYLYWLHVSGQGSREVSQAVTQHPSYASVAPALENYTYPVD